MNSGSSNSGELNGAKGELNFNQFIEPDSNVIDLKLWSEAKLWYETDRILNCRDTSIKEYYLEFVRFERSNHASLLYQKAKRKRSK